MLLFPVVYKVCRDYDRQRRLGIDPVFDPKALNIKGADFWHPDPVPAPTAALAGDAATRTGPEYEK